MSGPLNYSTQVPASRTIGECHALLVGHGASAIATEYAEQRAVGLSFRLLTPHGVRDFYMPINVDGVQRLMVDAQRRGKMRSMGKAAATSLAQAERVAWRIVKDWLEAQLAIIDAQLVTLEQVMLPYLVVGEFPSGERKTLYGAYVERETAALTAGGNDA